jgi:hypothetical protein
MNRNAVLLRITLLAILMASFSVGSARAQSASGLTGTVTDSSDAMVGGANVEVTNRASGAARNTTTNSDGVYVFPQLAPATYELKIAAKGFKTAVRDEVIVQVGLVSVLNVRLVLGEASETIVVQAVVGGINTQDASIGTPFNEDQIRQLPLEGRSIVGLLSLQSGAVYLPTQDIRSGSVSGSRSDQANITLDGVDANDAENQTAAYLGAIRAPLDSVKEFRTTTTNYGADFGRSSGPQVQLVTVSGTNKLHGSGYYFDRNTVFSSNEYFNKLAGQDRPKLNKHVFGASLGGSIFKDRLFVFGNYEGLRESSEVPVLRSVPSESLRDGVLIYECAVPASCPPGIVAGVHSPHPVPAGFFGLTPAQFAAIDPLAIGPNLDVLTHFNEYPIPNDPGSDGLNLMGYRFNSPINNRFDTGVLRVDFKVDKTGKQNLFWRFNVQNDTLSSAPQFPGEPSNSNTEVKNWASAIGYDRAIGTSAFNSFRWGFSRLLNSIVGLQTKSQISFLGIDDFPAITPASQRRIPSHDIRDDVTWTRGRHTFQVGGDLRFTRIPRQSNGNSFNGVLVDHTWGENLGRTYIPGLSTCTTPGCSQVPDVSGSYLSIFNVTSGDLLGVLTRGRANYNFNKDGSLLPTGDPVIRRYASDEYEWYVQDTWRVRPSLTITLGVRHSLYSPPWETNGNQVAPSPGWSEIYQGRKDGATQGIPSSAQLPLTFDLSGPANHRPGFYPWDKNNFAPRIGVAWNPHFKSGILGTLFGDGKTVIRGGYGIAFDRVGQALALSYDSGGGAFGLSSSLSAPFGVLNDINSPRFTGLYDLPGAPVIPDAPISGFPLTPQPGAFIVSNTIDDGIKTPYAHLLSFSVGRELPKNFSFEVSYVGRRGRKLLARRDFAQQVDLVDKTSGMDYYTAATMLAKFAAEGDPTGLSQGRPTSLVQPIAYWENLFPGAAGHPICDIDGLGGSATATQVAYDAFRCVAGDYSTALALMDVNFLCQPFGTCSKFGPYAYFMDQFCCMAGQSTIGTSEYHSLQMSLRKRFSQGLQFDFNYTLGKSLDLTSDVERGSVFGNFTSGGLSNYIVDAWNPHKQYGPSDFDLRHQLNANWIYELPIGKGKWLAKDASGWADRALGGWQVSGIYRWTSGFPFNVQGCGICFPTNQTLVGNAEFLGGSGIPATGTTRNAVDGFPSPFRNPADARTHFRPSFPGEVGLRNVLRGDGYFVIDLGVGKSFRMPWEGHRLQFRWETFNLTNTPKFDTASITATIDSPSSFGRYNRTLATCDSSAGRCMQFSVRYEF